MRRVSQQIGWSQESQLYYQWLVQLERLTAILGKNIVPTTTTTTTAAPLPSIIVGSQIWTSENLDVTTYRNGDAIPQVTDPTQWENLTTGAWCWYNNDSANGLVYGKLYNWYAVNDPRGLAPTGWHVASDAEWTILTDYLGGALIAGGAMKETGTTHWSSPNVDATNASTFTGLPGGVRSSSGGIFAVIGDYGDWWSSTDSLSSPWTRVLYYNSGETLIGNDYYTTGLSVRLIKN
jgi:uncharacterized protein (TIGR02145 family)